jgi:hypothetical protein
MDELVSFFSKKGFGGDVLWDQITAAAQNNLRRERIGCFAAGTLVHTREGLRPIEQIQVGDWVLSKPESGEGECEYKRVTETFSFEDREVWLVNIRPEVKEHVPADRIVVTGVHPLWLVGFLGDNDPELLSERYGIDSDALGWKTVGELSEIHNDSPGVLVKLLGNGCAAFSAYPLLKTETPELAVIMGVNFGEYSNQRSIRFEAGVPDLQTTPYLQFDGPYEGVDEYGHPRPIRYRCKVYNLTVEDHHTYFVGRNGLWVHNKNPDDLPSLHKRQSTQVKPQHGLKLI